MQASTIYYDVHSTDEARRAELAVGGCRSVRDCANAGCQVAPHFADIRVMMTHENNAMGD